MPIAASEKTGSFVEGFTKSQRKLFIELQELLAHQEPHLSWYHHTGCKLLELHEAVEKRGPGWCRDLADALSISPSSLTKMRKFASDFTERQAERLDQIGCNWGMAVAVLHVHADRMKLLEDALAKNRSVTELQAAVKAKFGARNPGGRPLRRPRTMEEGLKRLQELGEKWLRFYREVWADGDEPLQERWRELSPKDMQRLAKLLPVVRRTMQEVQRSALAVDKILGELERKARRS